MRIKFNTLFSVSLEHEYFKDTIPQAISIEPVSETSSLLEDSGLLFRQTRQGFAILYEEDPVDGAKLLREIPPNQVYRFVLAVNDPFFINYTDLPLNHRLPQILFLNNLQENISEGQLLLHPLNVISLERPVLKPQIFSYNDSATSGSVSLEVKDLNGQKKFEKQLIAMQGKVIGTIDLSQEPPGRYDLFVDGILKEKLYLDSKLSRISLIGIIEIFASGVPAPYRFISGTGSVTARSYKIKLGSRKSFWKYIVVLNNIDENDGFRIDYENPDEDEAVYPEDVVFSEEPVTQELADLYGTGKVLLFQSDIKIPLNEVPKKSIKLSYTPDGAGSPEVLIANLPNPGVSSVKPDNDNQEAFSEIFIQV